MNDERIMTRLLRRLKSGRASVFLEFAVIAPFVMSLVLFAHDFTSILYAEQQLEIGSRALADIESHMNHTDRGGSSGVPVGPGRASKVIVKKYLVKVLGVPRYDDFVYVKGSASPTPGAPQIFEHIHDFFTGNIAGKDSPGGPIWNFLGTILGGIVKIVTLGTDVYLFEVPRGDRMVKMTCSARIPTLLPRGVYDFWSAPDQSRGGVDTTAVPKAMVIQYRYPIDADTQSFSWAWGNKPHLDERERYYCTMPMFDTAALAPNTFVRKVRSWFAKWIPGGIGDDDD